jgi:hypothetical protein
LNENAVQEINKLKNGNGISNTAIGRTEMYTVENAGPEEEQQSCRSGKRKNSEMTGSFAFLIRYNNVENLQSVLHATSRDNAQATFSYDMGDVVRICVYGHAKTADP